MLQKYLGFFAAGSLFKFKKFGSCQQMFGPFLVDNLNKRREIVCWHHPQRVNCLFLEKMSIKRIDVALGQIAIFILFSFDFA